MGPAAGGKTPHQPENDPLHLGPLQDHQHGSEGRKKSGNSDPGEQEDGQGNPPPDAGQVINKNRGQQRPGKSQDGNRA